MGADPAWISLALTLPSSNTGWLAAFSRGFTQLAEDFGLQLVGGDTTQGPLTICVQALGFVEPGRALTRSGARPGDDIYVSGTLGDAGLALRIRQGLPWPPREQASALERRLDRPLPRVAEGRALRGLASAAIDISDGLGADLVHILRASGVGATIYLERLPLGEAVTAYVAQTGDWGLPLSAGDDYELCVAVPRARREDLDRAMAPYSRFTRIGSVGTRPGLRCLLPDGSELDSAPGGFQHFSSDR